MESCHQTRVKDSLEKLNVPAWYRDRQERAERRRHESGESTQSSVSRWRCGSGRAGIQGGWSAYKRESGSYSQQTSRDNSRCSTPANRDRPLYHSSYTRWSTSKLNYIAGKESSFTTPGTSPAHSSYSIKSLASSTNGSYNTYRQQYMGWRSQEQLKNTSSTDLISNPAQRLASSSIRPNSANNATSRRKPVKISDYSDFYQEKREKSVPKQDNSALHESIKQVTVAIDDYCKSSKRSRRPLTSKGTYEGLMESKQFSTGGHLWMESSFLPTKSKHQSRSSSAKSRMEYTDWRNNGDLGLDILRLEDQIF